MTLCKLPLSNGVHDGMKKCLNWTMNVCGTNVVEPFERPLCSSHSLWRRCGQGDGPITHEISKWSMRVINGAVDTDVIPLLRIFRTCEDGVQVQRSGGMDRPIPIFDVFVVCMVVLMCHDGVEKDEDRGYVVLMLINDPVNVSPGEIDECTKKCTAQVVVLVITRLG